MSDRICTKCGAGTPIGCFLCAPEAYPRDGAFDLQVRIDQQRETIGRLIGLINQADGYRDRIAELEAEVVRRERENEAAWDSAEHNARRAEAAEAKLRAVGELPRYAVDARYLHNSVDLHITPDERGRFIRAYDIDALLKESAL